MNLQLMRAGICLVNMSEEANKKQRKPDSDLQKAQRDMAFKLRQIKGMQANLRKMLYNGNYFVRASIDSALSDLDKLELHVKEQYGFTRGFILKRRSKKLTDLVLR